VRIALGVSYLGTAYEGWQSQLSGRTVQDHLQQAIAAFLDHPCPNVVCAGRTDAGVHGLMQVVHFDTQTHRQLASWVRGTNRYLPCDIAVQWAREVPTHFHARAQARSRRYVYVLLESPVRPSLEAQRAGWVFQPLDGDAMRSAAQHLVGTHDFSSFRAAQCQAPSPIKTLQPIVIQRCGAYWRFDFEGDAFLHHMIRNIMGCLVMIGQGTRPPLWMAQVRDARSREAAAPTFSPHGLYFLGPRYEAHWGLPEHTAAFDWLPSAAHTPSASPVHAPSCALSS
jgi:tRNA pseudouridine38-40 synthase